MSFAILQKNDADGAVIELRSNIGTFEQAKAILEEMLEAYEAHGYDPKQHQWWAHKSGAKYTFWVQGR